jgi:electron transfer flavoprotein beta subunit
MGESMNSNKGQGLLIAVCLKQVSFVYARSGTSPDRSFIDERDWVRFNNPADEEALELALRIKEQGEDVRVWVFCLGSEIISHEASRALAMGADRFIWLNDPAWTNDDSQNVAAILAEAVKKAGADLILCGAASLDVGKGEVGPLIAHYLAFPFIPSAMALNCIAGKGQMRVTSALGRGDRLVSTATLPLVASVDPGTIPVRYPSHLDMLKAKAQGTSCWGHKELGMEDGSADAAEGAVGEITAPRPRVKSIPFLDGNLPAHDRVSWLLAERSQDKAGELLGGNAATLAKSLVDFLEKRGLLNRKTAH